MSVNKSRTTPKQVRSLAGSFLRDSLAQLTEVWRCVLLWGFAIAAVIFVGFKINGSLSGDDFSAKTLAVIALCASLASAIAGTSNFVFSRLRLISVRDIHDSYSRSRMGEDYYRFGVDVVSYGAPIWDLSATIEMNVPVIEDPLLRDIAGTYVIPLAPEGPLVNPLNAGQGQRFVVARQVNPMDQLNDARGAPGEIWSRVPYLKRENIKLCIYSAGGRILLREIRSPIFHWRLNNYFNKALGLNAPWWQAIRMRREIARLSKEAPFRPWDGKIARMRELERELSTEPHPPKMS